MNKRTIIYMLLISIFVFSLPACGTATPTQAPAATLPPAVVPATAVPPTVIPPTTIPPVACGVFRSARQFVHEGFYGWHR